MSEFKVHHHVSELFTLMGIEQETAEKHAEKLSDSVQRFVSNQVSSSNSVCLVAEAAPDPQAFLTKYYELKSRNVHNLDAMVVFLCGLVEDRAARRVIESGSEQLMQREGMSFTPVSTILHDIGHGGEIKLSQDQLCMLKERLLKETEFTHVPSEAIISVSLFNKKNCLIGPTIPPCLTNRKYLSLDFVQGEDSPNASGPLSEIPLTTQENQLIEDLLSLMMGLGGTYIKVHVSNQPYLPPTFTVDPSIEPSLVALVGRILPLCGHYSLVIRFIQDYWEYHYGLVNQALAAAMRNLIRDYMFLLTQLETQQQKWALTLHKFWFYVEKTISVMEVLACLSSSIRKSDAHGGSVLSLLHERTLSLTGCGQLQDVMVYLTQAAAIPYMEMLAKWIYRGIISDPYDEFLVKDSDIFCEEDNLETGGWGAGDLTDDYWEKRYTISLHNIPAFLQSHSHIILRTGKYLNVIRQSDPTVVCPSQEPLVYTVRDKSYADVIENTYNFASKRLLQLLMKEKDLMGRLRSMKHYFLLDQGDFVVQMLTLCEGELEKNIDDVVPTRLESLLELALRTSVANSDPYKDDVQCELLPFTLMSQMVRILSIDKEAENDFWPPTERLQLTGLQGFSLSYNVAWPVSLVLDRKALTLYQMIFRHLFYCKHVERLLCRVWLNNKVAKSFSLSASRTYVSAFTLRQRMLNFIQNIEYYMMFEVVERNWQIFINKMLKVENIDDVLLLHSDFLNACLKDCMLTNHELLRIINKLTSICVAFSNFILKMQRYFLEAELWISDERQDSVEREVSPEPVATSHEESESFEQHINKFELEFSAMLITLIARISDMGRDNYNDALVNVLYRLDLNGFYSMRKESLLVSSSSETSLDYNSAPISG